jgi:hypothetical protein
MPRAGEIRTPQPSEAALRRSGGRTAGIETLGNGNNKLRWRERLPYDTWPGPTRRLSVRRITKEE